MIEIQRFDDVERIRLASWGSRVAGMDVSALVVYGVLVDSGFPHASSALGSFLDERPIIGAMLKHYHEDHAGNAELIAGRGIFFFSSRRRHTRLQGDWSSDVCSSD